MVLMASPAGGEGIRRGATCTGKWLARYAEGDAPSDTLDRSQMWFV